PVPMRPRKLLSTFISTAPIKLALATAQPPGFPSMEVVVVDPGADCVLGEWSKLSVLLMASSVAFPPTGELFIFFLSSFASLCLLRIYFTSTLSDPSYFLLAPLASPLEPVSAGGAGLWCV